MIRLRMSRLWLVVKRFSWGVADQAFSSVTNFALGILVARSVDLSSFGAFGLALATYATAVGISRGLNSQPLMVRYSAAPTAEWRAAVSSSCGSALTVGFLLGAVCAMAGWFLGGVLGDVLFILGVSMPGLLLQDCWRWAFFAANRGAAAFVNDLLWAVVMFPVFVVVLRSDARPSVALLTLVWSASATAAAAFGVIQAGTWPNPARSRVWWREHRDLGPRFVGEFVVTNGSTQLGVYAVAAVGGLNVIGAIRAAHVLFGPFNVLSMGIGMVAIPESVRALERSVEHLRRTISFLSRALALGALVWGAAILLLPASVGTWLMGPTWVAARSVIIPIAILRAATGVVAAIVTGFRAIVAARSSFWVRLITAPLPIVTGATGAAVGGTTGAAWGITSGAVIAAVIWHQRLNAALMRRGSPMPHDVVATANPEMMLGD